MTEAVRALLAALLSLYRPPAATRERIDRTRDAIVTAVTEAAEQHGVPPAVLLVVGFSETHLGTDVGEGGGWGAPVDRRHRHTAGNAGHAARSLAWGYRHCGTWQMAVAFFRTGPCRPRHPSGYTAAGTMRIVARVSALAGAAVP